MEVQKMLFVREFQLLAWMVSVNMFVIFSGFSGTELRKTIACELDFIEEGKNSERTARNFKNNRSVKIPTVYWDFTSKQVLTMEFCEGKKVDDLEAFKQMGISPFVVAKTLVDVFAEMIFVHGFLHGDPHPGNILVSPQGPKGFSLVILDHGNYKHLPEDFRVNCCHLLEALITLDSPKLQQLGEAFGVGKYAKYIPVISTGRTINSGLLRSLTSNESKYRLMLDVPCAVCLQRQVLDQVLQCMLCPELRLASYTLT